MTNLKDTIQVGIANGSAISVSLVEANEFLTFVSLTLAIVFTVYKFFIYEKRKINSTNPKWIKTDGKPLKVRKEFVSEVKGVKISKIYYL